MLASRGRGVNARGTIIAAVLLPPRRRLLATLALALGACAPVASGRGPAPTLGEVLGSWERQTGAYFPFNASERGARQFDRVLANDIGEAYRRGLGVLCADHLAMVRRVDVDALGEEDRVTRDVLDFRLAACVEGLTFPWHLMPVNQTGSSWPSRFPILGAGRGQHRFATVQNYDDFLGRIDGFVAWMDTAVANMREGMARGLTQPRVVMERVLPQLDAQLVDAPEASLFWEPIRTLPTGFDAETRHRLTTAYRHAIAEKILPAYRRMRAFIAEEYLPRCRTSYGIGDLPDGRRMYAFAARLATTTEMTPDEIHALGLSEVRRLGDAIAALRAERSAVREPAAPAYTTTADLVAAYTALGTEVQAALPRLFGRLPRTVYEIRRIEPYREPSMPSSYVAGAADGTRPGVFYLNAAELDRGPARVHRNLFLHEAIPGHHFQIMVQRENRALPPYRRFVSHTAFVEGWALYAEGLGHELGVYHTRRDRLDALFGERFRAARLVVDTGLHAKGWTHEQVTQYLGGGPNADREAVRYMAWPGQALAYKIGQLRILALRRRAEAALGPAFDIRAFHDTLLEGGSLPLTVLEAKMDRWIERRRAGRS
jgi:uncharacterized protein (DUF885 family)